MSAVGKWTVVYTLVCVCVMPWLVNTVTQQRHVRPKSYLVHRCPIVSWRTLLFLVLISCDTPHFLLDHSRALVQTSTLMLWTLSSSRNLWGDKMYLTHYPCNHLFSQTTTMGFEMNQSYLVGAQYIVSLFNVSACWTCPFFLTLKFREMWYALFRY